jgi:DNA (cytosine-5)-methyltransferase 1
MTGFMEWPDAAIDVLVGGTPCQSYSVAGLRKGLDDPRGALMLVYLAIARRYRPKWMVWENVPGVLSSDDGRAFGTLLGGLALLGYGFAYRILDAQYFRLAQRRRRVFVVAHLGDWRRAAAVLFERESLSGHPAPRRDAGQAAPTIPSRSTAGGGLGTDCDGGLVGTLVGGQSAGGHGRFLSADAAAQNMLVPSVCPALKARDSKGPSSDGDGDGACLVPVAFGIRSDAARDGAAKTPSPDAEGRVRLRDAGFNIYENISPTIDASAAHAVAFQANALFCTAVDEDICPTMQSQKSGGSGMPAVAFANTAGDTALGMSKPGVPPITGRNGDPGNVLLGMQVRRLTPRECERLQGFPDDYTLIPYRGKPAKDGPRYKALGNSMAVPVMRWIGQRIAMVNAL